MTDTPKVGEKRWIWHYDDLRQVDVRGTYEISGRLHIEYGGFATPFFFKDRLSAIEYRVRFLCAEIVTVRKEFPANQGMDILCDVAETTLLALKQPFTDASSTET